MRKRLRTIAHGLLALALAALPLAWPARADNPVFGGVYGNVYLLTTDVLWIQATGTPVNVIYTGNFRIRPKDGNLAAATYSYSCQIGTNANGGLGCGVYAPVEGTLLTWTLVVGTGIVTTGQVETQMMILPSMPAGGQATLGPALNVVGANTVGLSQILYYLANCNMSSFQSCGWPAQPPQPIVNGWFNQSQIVGNPAAGLNFSAPLSQFWRVRVISVRLTLTTSAAAANRFVNLTLSNSTPTVIAGSACANPQPASLTVTYDFEAGVGPSSTPVVQGVGGAVVQPVEVVCSLPLYWEITQATGDGAGTSSALASVITNLQGADTVTNVVIRYQAIHEFD